MCLLGAVWQRYPFPMQCAHSALKVTGRVRFKANRSPFPDVRLLSAHPTPMAPVPRRWAEVPLTAGLPGVPRTPSLLPFSYHPI